MSEVRLVEPVVRICAVITSFADARAWAFKRLETHWGPITDRSAEIPFEAGGFYLDSMGPNLTKTLVAFEPFEDPGELSEWKVQSNAWEAEYANQSTNMVARPVNLDAGYLSQAKLVLATIKDRDHRIYLRDGIFAEVTLSYVGKKWIHHRWSYPSYRTNEVSDFAMKNRARLREHLLATGQIRTGEPKRE
ncbi:DUF4416 family protein [Rubripirellula amarantea]|nr:DUF4416 family protein [Rubripirellula amarantea]